jgi:hypothetical protein
MKAGGVEYHAKDQSIIVNGLTHQPNSGFFRQQ